MAAVVLVHGSTYDRRYWDPPGLPADRYSMLRLLAGRGLLVVAVDRLGSGGSDRPPDAEVTADVSVEALHGVVRQLRRDPRYRTRASRLFVVGHSSGATLAIREAATYDDVDGLVTMGILHTQAVSTDLFSPMLRPAGEDPRFVGLPIPAGYVTTWPGVRRLWYYPGNVDEQAFLADETRLRDAMPSGDAGGYVDEIFGEVQRSRQVKASVLVVVGGWDQDACTPPGCPEAAAEPGFWSVSRGVRVVVRPRVGHALNLHRDAAETTGLVGGWLLNRVA